MRDPWRTLGFEAYFERLRAMAFGRRRAPLIPLFWLGSEAEEHPIGRR